MKSVKTIKSIKVSFLEIYNETIRDLIIPSKETLELREDPILGVIVSGLTFIEVQNHSEIFEILLKGNNNRT